MYNTYRYVVANEGVDSQSSYSYKGRVSKTHFTARPMMDLAILIPVQQYSCSYTQNGMSAQMSGCVRITQSSETDLLTAVAYVGPVSVAVDANNNAFRVSAT